MADEPRRSGRATKGQHTKNEDEPPDAMKKRGKGGRGKAAKKAAEEVQDEEEEAIIRCICGYVVEDPNDKRAMICCDKCLAWQHNVCMGLSTDDEDLPDTYFCEQCKPEDHKETLAALAKGEPIWETRQAEEQREEEERKSRKRKGGRKSKGGRVSEVAPVEKKEAAPTPQKKKEVTPVETQPPPSPIAETPTAPTPKPVKVETGSKRKTPTELPLDASHANDSAVSSKARKVSTPKETKPPARRQSSAATPSARRDSKEVPLQAELVETIEELHSLIRQRAAKALVKLFVDATQQAQKESSFKLSTGQSEAAFGLRLGLTVEYSLYMNFWGHGESPTSRYGEKLRTIIHNVKDNKSLRDRLLHGSLSPHDLTNMTSLDMARKELQEQRDKILKESEKQHVLVQEDGPRIRRTHKGDEMIVDESQHLTNAEPVQTAPSRPRRDSNDAKEASPEQMSPRSPNNVELPPDIGKSPTSTRPLTVDTKTARPKPPPQRKQSTSTNFNMDNVWSSVDSPSMNRPVPIPTTPSSTTATTRGPGAKADPEIDSLLKDEDDSDEPYSPMDYEMEPGTIWRGNVLMPTVAEFRGSAKHVAGADLHSIYPWPTLMPNLLIIEGRIPVDRASDYLCGLRWSKTTDVSVVSVTPAEHQLDKDAFDKLFTYFTTRSRYGVVVESPVPNVRDVYVVPLEAGAAKKPEFIELLQESTVEDVRAQRQLLVTYVIKIRADGAPLPGSATNPAASAVPRGAELLNSPVAPQGLGQGPGQGQGQTQPQPQGPATGYSPLNPSVAAFPPPATFPPPVVGAAGGPVSAGPKGWDAAHAVLGPELVQAPTVAQLVASAPDTGESQWVVIKTVLEEDVRNRTDWAGLMGGLQRRVGGGG